jgi:hypothetical protein
LFVLEDMKCGVIGRLVPGRHLHRPHAVAVLLAVAAFMWSCITSTTRLPQGGGAQADANARDGVDSSWNFLGDIDGVRTYSRQMPESASLSFKGVTDVDLPMSSMVGAFTPASLPSSPLVLPPTLPLSPPPHRWELSSTFQ